MPDSARVDFVASTPLRAVEWPRLVASLWPRAPELPTCLTAPLTGDAVLLGRFQCADSVLGESAELPVARRATGGRALRVGDGCQAFLLVLPDTGALLTEGRPVPAGKIVNRYVRPALGALAVFGASAGWFGRDFISVSGRPVAYVSFDATAEGAALVEVIFSFERPLLWEGAYPGVGPGPEGERPWAGLSEIVGPGRKLPTPAEWDAALRRGFEERLSATLGEAQPAPALSDTLWPAASEPLPPRGSPLFDVPIGHLEARVEIDQLAQMRRPELGTTRVLGRARLLGDFQAPAPSVARLEASLAGCAATFEQLGARVDATFGPTAGGTLVGLTSLRPIAEALLQAAAARS